MPVHLSTILARNPALIEQQVRALANKFAHRKDLLCLFSLSASESVDWTNSWQQLRRIGGSGTDTSVGCLSSSFNNVQGDLRSSGKPSGRAKPLGGYLSCSIGVFDRDEAIPFHSRIQGDEQPQVGRWHSFRKQREPTKWDEDLHMDREISWEQIWKQSQDEATVTLRELEGVRDEDVSAFVYFTDRTYQGLARSLTRFYPSASKLGLLAPSTLTVNEKPLSMLYGGKMLSEGAIGLALKSSSSRPTLSLGFNGTRPISSPLTVTSSQGNMINLLNDSNPTQLLLKALEVAFPTSDISSNPTHSPMYQLLNEKIFVGIRDPKDGNIARMHQISAGDPSRGPLSLLVERAPLIGSEIQFFVCPQSNPIPLSPTSKPEIQFVSVAELMPSEYEALTLGSEDEVHVIQDKFIVASDAGIVVHRAEEGIEAVGIGGPAGTTGAIGWSL